MRGELITIDTDGRTTRRPSKPSHYRELMKAIGTMSGVDMVSGFTDTDGQWCDAYVADDGIAKGLALN